MSGHSVGIIGFGRFGQYVAKCLKDNFAVVVTNRTDRRKEAKRIGVRYTDQKECAKQDIVILCLSISSIEEVLNDVAPFLKKGALVLDTCSVKEYPVAVMQKIIPQYCECIGTHPLFGPDTTKNGIEGKKIALCPIRTKRLGRVVSFLEKIGLETIVLTPEEHDRQMARSLALIHFFGNALSKIDIKSVDVATATHERLKELVTIVENDSDQLFFDMHHYNRFTQEVRRKLIDELVSIDKRLSK